MKNDRCDDDYELKTLLELNGNKTTHYEFDSASQLIEDFWNTVEKYI